MRQAGKLVKRLWLVWQAKQILNEKNLDHEFRFQIVGLSDFRIGTTFHIEERVTAQKKHQVIF